MGRMKFLADEHVDSAYLSALRSNGYTVRAVGDAYEAGDSDDRLIAAGRAENLVILTNDVDFVRLARNHDHSGIVKYDRFDHTPRDFVRAIDRIDRHIPISEFDDHVEWLENWL